MLENYEGTALDTFEQNDVTEVQPMESTNTQPEDGDQLGVDETNDSSSNETSTVDDGMYDIPGIGKVSADEIKEWKQGNLRQSDYTRKTQELARQREQNKDAMDLYEHLQKNPHLIGAIKQAELGNSPVVNNMSTDNQLLRKVIHDQKAMELDMKLTQMKEKYGAFDEVAVLNKAAELKTEDLEFVLSGLKNAEPLNMEELKAQMIQQAKAELKAELESNRDAVGTTVSNKGKTIEKVNNLTPEQKRVAQAMGMSESEYAKWM